MRNPAYTQRVKKRFVLTSRRQTLEGRLATHHAVDQAQYVVRFMKRAVPFQQLKPVIYQLSAPQALHHASHQPNAPSIGG